MVGGVIVVVVVALISNIPSETAATRDIFHQNPIAKTLLSTPPSLSPPHASTKDNDVCKTLVEPHGYICQDYQVTTEDGYILGMQRIPAGRSGKKANKPPVLIQHGIVSDAALWLVSSPDQCLPFIMADNGYDVWLSNARGTSSSRAHKSLSPNDAKFWDWTWVELAAYDLPAFVEGVHNQTGQNLHYVGHSLGTLMALTAFSQDFKPINMLRSATLLSPIAYMNQIPSILLKTITEFFLAEAGNLLGLHEFVPASKEVSTILGFVCNTPGIDCASLETALTGPNCCIDKRTVERYIGHQLQSTSMKTLVHLSQMIRTGTIRKYDNVIINENMKQYNQPTPPAYDLSKIPKDLPLFMSYGKNDYLSDVNDVKVLLDKIKDHDKDKLVVQFVDNYAHMDFVMANNTKHVVFDRVTAFIALH
ncbi:triacylglycerol lipase 2-like [Humulus lupulus]|uniref:triacylglycerol lipase 2-like n=1 Tax=Humulus lupulus TaxID=3486 RepID=UPI002B4125E6|nr:triacylglycerol lipase 2-like [Humulus lupulus]